MKALEPRCLISAERRRVCFCLGQDRRSAASALEATKVVVLVGLREFEERLFETWAHGMWIKIGGAAVPP